ncbi:MAG: hypothetical protein MI921_14425 [Cytophagales bacterium]|nr:hypothetical protein [Cytophagales bacterium]
MTKHINDLRIVLQEWMNNTCDNIPENLTKDRYTGDTGQRIDTAYRIRGEMPGKANNVENINRD